MKTKVVFFLHFLCVMLVLGALCSMANAQTNSVSLETACINGLQVDINGAATPGASVISILWSWGDGTTTNGGFPQSHTYSSAGTYTVVVTAAYSGGVSASASQAVIVAPGTLSNCVALMIMADQNGSVSYQASVGSGTVPAGTSATLELDFADDLSLTANPGAGFSFSTWFWSGNITGLSGTPVNTLSPSITIVVGGNSTIQAYFGTQPFFVYTFTGTATGTLGSNAFESATFTITVVADTIDIRPNTACTASGDICFALDSSWSTISIDGFPLAHVLTPTEVFDNQTTGAVGYERSPDLANILDLYDPAFLSYDLSTSLGPIVVVPDNIFVYQFNCNAPWGCVSTDQGSVTFSSVGSVTFTASPLVAETGTTMQPGSSTGLSQSFVFNSTTAQHLEFDLDYTTAYTNGTLTVQPDTVPTVSNLGITQTTYESMVAGTSLATTTCYIAPAEGTDASGNPLCAEITLTCTNGGTSPGSSTPAGDNCPTSTARNLFWANQLETSTSISIPPGYAPTLAMGPDTWSPGNCAFNGPETGNLCPDSVLTQFLETSTDPGTKSGGTKPSSNSTYIAGCCEPMWSTTPTVPMWYNNTTVPVSFTTEPPSITPTNGWVAAPNQSITWGVEALGSTPDPTYPIPGDQTATNTTACPSTWPSPGTTPPSFTTPSGETVTVPAEGLYEVHYFSTACDNQEELAFTPSTVPTQNWAAFKTVAFGVDTTNPTVTNLALSTGSGNPVPLNWPVTASFTCTDPLGSTGVASGLAGCGKQVTLPVPPVPGLAGPTSPTQGSTSINVSGFPVSTSTTGPQTLTVYATDLAGNTGSAAVPYTVCHHYVSIGFNPSSVSPGGITIVTGTLMSCLNTAQTVAITFSLKGPLQPNACSSSESFMFTTPPFTLRPNTDQTVSFPFLVLKKTCAGTYNVVATTTSSGVVVDTSSASLTVK